MNSFNIARNILNDIRDDIEIIRNADAILYDNPRHYLQKRLNKMVGVFAKKYEIECVPRFSNNFMGYVTGALDEVGVELSNISELVNSESLGYVTLCGSTKFGQAYDSWNGALTLQNNVVLSVSLKGHADDITLSPQEKGLLDQIHRTKIDLCGYNMFVLTGNFLEKFSYDMKLSDIDPGYYGSSTSSEIEYRKHSLNTGRSTITPSAHSNIVFDTDVFKTATILRCAADLITGARK